MNRMCAVNSGEAMLVESIQSGAGVSGSVCEGRGHGYGKRPVATKLSLASSLKFTTGALLLGLASVVQATLPIQSWKTSSGATVMFMRAEALPMLDVQVAFPAGSRADPEGKEGLASVVAGLLSTGVKGLDEQQIADGFADTGAQFSAGASDDYATAGLRTLTSEPEFTQSVELFSRVIQQPVFDKSILDREINRGLASLRESLTKPGTLASRAFSKNTYPNQPYGMLTTEGSLQRIGVEDLESFYQGHYLGNYAVVSMVGNLTRAQAEKLAEQLTKGLPLNTLPGNPLGGEDYKALQSRMEGKTVVIPHPAAQSHIIVGLPAMKRGTPDYFDLLVANHVIGGGGFTSLLMKEIRENRGLAYSTYSFFRPMGDAGPYTAAVQTKKEQTDEALKVMTDTLNRFIKEGPTQEQLDAAKSNLIDGFPLRIDSNSDLVGNLTMMGVYGMPLNYLDVWTDKISKVTVQTAKEAFARHVNPAKLVIVVVGPDKLN